MKQGNRAIVLEHHLLLGTMVDAKVAEFCECDVSAVCRVRNSLNIVPWRKHRFSRGINVEKDVKHFLGKVPDTDIGRKFEVSREAVRQWRGRFGIARFRRKCK